MVDEKDLAAKLTLLKEIKPKENWMLFAKTRILADSELSAADVRSWRSNILGHVLSYVRYLEKAIRQGLRVSLSRTPQAKPAFVFAALAFVVLGGVGYKISQNSLPGDVLYSVRSIIEKTTISSDPLASLEVAQLRLADLKKVVEENRVKNLSFATKEFNQSVAQVSKGFLLLVEKEPAKALQASRELVQLQKDKAQIEQLLGVSIGGKEVSSLENTTRILVEAELNDLVTRTLSEEQKELLEQAIIAYQAVDYEQALEGIWSISN